MAMERKALRSQKGLAMAFVVSFKYRIQSFDCDARVPYIDFEYTSKEYSKSQVDEYIKALCDRCMACPYVSFWDLKVTRV